MMESHCSNPLPYLPSQNNQASRQVTAVCPVEKFYMCFLISNIAPVFLNQPFSLCKQSNSVFGRVESGAGLW